LAGNCGLAVAGTATGAAVPAAAKPLGVFFAKKRHFPLTRRLLMVKFQTFGIKNKDD
jgi:hypothetical protein